MLLFLRSGNGNQVEPKKSKRKLEANEHLNDESTPSKNGVETTQERNEGAKKGKKKKKN